MSRPLAVLRPEPGNAVTAARIAAAGGSAIRLPLFAVRALRWSAPDPSGFDALLVTSANAPRHAGPELARLAHLPALAVGAASAAAARAAGLRVERTGDTDARALVAAAGGRRLLHLAGRERTPLPDVAAIAVYAAEPVPGIDPALLRGTVALLHSARAARRLAELADEGGFARGDVRLAALSDAVAAAAGARWDRIVVAPVPSDAALVAAAIDATD